MTSLGKIELEPLESRFEEQVSRYRNLWAAKLLIHVNDYKEGVDRIRNNRKYSSYKMMLKRGGHFADAKAWIENESNEPSSFNWICLVLGVDCDVTRTKIISYGKDNEQGQGPARRSGSD